MLKFRMYDKFSVDASLGISVAENDRGEWKKEVVSGSGTEFLGFDGENSLVIVPMSMQSGIWDVVVVYSVVDSYSKVGHVAGKDLDRAINEAVAQVYPGC